MRGRTATCREGQGRLCLRGAPHRRQGAHCPLVPPARARDTARPEPSESSVLLLLRHGGPCSGGRRTAETCHWR